MAMSMKDFLIAYYKQLHFDNMSPEVRARFDEYKKNLDFAGDMKDWATNLDGRPLPDANAELNNEDWDKLFNAFNVALGRMAQDSDGLAGNKQAREFVTEYYGSGKLFSIEPVDGSTEGEIGKLKNNISHLKGAIQNFLPEDVSFEQFEKNLNSGKYNTDEKFRNVLSRVIDRLDSAKQWGLQGASQEAINALNAIDTAKIAAGFEQKPNPGKLASFKQEYKSILNKLHDKTKLREMFGQYDDGKISKPLNKALGKVAYDDKDSKSYIHPKSSDELNLWQQVQKWTADTYENCLEKYVKLSGDRLFFSMPAQMICKGIDGAKIKPTDGISAVLDNADKIKKGLQYKSPAAIAHFDWFVKEMNVLKDAMPKAFEGGLRNGPQLRHLIEKIIVDAIDQGKIKEAKTTMEILSVIKYGNTTSKIMDAIKEDKDLFTLMSNKDLSWNKNEGVKFVTTALDKSVRAAFIGLGYGATMAINGIRKSRSKIKRPGKLLNKAHEDWRTDTEAQKLDMQNAHDRAERRKIWAERFVNASRPQTAIEHDITMWENGIQNTENNLTPQLNALQNQLQQMLNDPATANDPDAHKIEQYLTDIQAENPNITKPQLNSAATNWQYLVDNIDTQLNILSTQKGRLDSNQEELNDVLGGISVINAAEQQMNDTQIKLTTWNADHTDQYEELIDFWNRLETGRDSHTGEMYSWRPGSKKKKQEAFWNQHGRGI